MSTGLGMSEELEVIAGEREIWESLLRLLLPDMNNLFTFSSLNYKNTSVG